MDMIALDSHKHYSIARVQTPRGRCLAEGRIEHRRGNIRQFLQGYRPGCPVAVETVGTWYWIVGEIEQAGMVPCLVHARKAKLMLGAINKTDKLDVRGLNLLQQTGTLPTVWIPPAPVRDQRELPRTRMVFAAWRTGLKNRIHSVLDTYGLQDQFTGISDIFGKGVRPTLLGAVAQLPPHTAYTAGLLLEQLQQVEQTLAQLETRMREIFAPPSDAVVGQPSGRGVDSLGGDGLGDRGGWAVQGSSETGLLCRDRAPAAMHRRHSPVRAHPLRREPLSQMGLRRGGQLGGAES